MISIMLDNDIAGYRDLFDGTLHSAGWDEYQLIEFITMDEAGLASDSPDSEVWRSCQQRRFLLLTANAIWTTKVLSNKPCDKKTLLSLSR